MSSTIYLIRHVESAHNVTKDFNHRDPGLTNLGFAQASSLATSFPALDSVAVVLTSPLTRTLETTLTAFQAILPNNNSLATGITPQTAAAAGARLIIDPDLQERSDLPCDTGSDPEALSAKVPGVDFSCLGERWYVKEGEYAADDEAVVARAARVRHTLQAFVDGWAWDGTSSGGRRRDIAVVTHGVFMKYLAQDETLDLPKAGCKAYYTVYSTEDGEPVLVPVE